MGNAPAAQTTGTGNRTKALVASAVVLVIAVGVAAYVVRSSRSSTSSNLAAAAAAPPGVAPQNFAPADLGATLTVPSTWANTPPSSGFQDVIRGTTSPAGFVGAGRRGGVVPITVDQVASQRSTFLKSNGAQIDSVTKGTVDKRPAVRLRYTISRNGITVNDTEYDVIAANTLAVGATQHQTTYAVVTIVIGTPSGQPNQALVDWISSTVKIR